MNRKTPNPMRGQLMQGVQKMIPDSGLTYFVIAHRIGVATNVIASYMGKNPRLPSVETLAVLCRVLGVSVDEVMGLGKDGYNGSGT